MFDVLAPIQLWPNLHTLCKVSPCPLTKGLLTIGEERSPLSSPHLRRTNCLQAAKLSEAIVENVEEPIN